MTDCVDCGRPMRRYRERAEDHPGTVTPSSTTRCRTCLRHTQAESNADVGRTTNASWVADGLCAQTDPEAYFPERGGSTHEAKRVCNGTPKRGIDPCPVRQQCLEYALANNEAYGVWGGLSEPERRKLGRANAAA